jgi:hypothetical protein
VIVANPPIVPRQDVAPFVKPTGAVDGESRFGKDWWLFFNNLQSSLKNLIATVAGIRLQYLQETTLASGANAITPTVTSATEGDILVLKLTQPGGGGGNVSWSSTYWAGVTANDNDRVANHINCYVFTWTSEGKWRLVSMLLGRS